MHCSLHCLIDVCVSASSARQVDMLPEIAVSPKIHCNVSVFITPQELRNNLDSYLKNRTPVTFLTELRGYLQASTNSVSRGCWNLLNNNNIP